MLRLALDVDVIADYEIARFTELHTDGRIRAGRLVIDGGARLKNAPLIRAWQESFGPDSVRFVRNHAKIATVESSRLPVLLRGSMNLNHNPRFEQLDVTEGGLHLTLDLVYNQGGAEGDASQRYVLRQTRRMRSNERHYIDHPQFGVIAIVTPRAG